MKPIAIEETLEKWASALRQIIDIEIDIDTDGEQLFLCLEKRQRSIDEIRKLDALIRETMEFRRNGWPGIDSQTRTRFEKILDSVFNICTQIVGSDRQLIEKAQQKRIDISSRLQKVRQGNNYITSSDPLKVRPPVIVDNNA